MRKAGDFFFMTVMLLAVFTFTVSCSGGRNPDKEAALAPAEKVAKIGGIEFEIIDSADSAALPASIQISSSNEISGTGLLVAREPLSDVKIGRHFTVRGGLTDGGSLRLTTFAIREADLLKNGFEIEISRVPGALGLKVIAKAGTTEDDWSQFFSKLSPSEEFEIGVDIHNDENGEAHVLVWNLKDTATKEPIFDSAVDVNGAPGKGFGRQWAIHLTDAVLRQVSVGEPRDDH